MMPVVTTSTSTRKRRKQQCVTSSRVLSFFLKRTSARAAEDHSRPLLHSLLSFSSLTPAACLFFVLTFLSHSPLPRLFFLTLRLGTLSGMSPATTTATAEKARNCAGTDRYQSETEGYGARVSCSLAVHLALAHKVLTHTHTHKKYAATNVTSIPRSCSCRFRGRRDLSGAERSARSGNRDEVCLRRPCVHSNRSQR